MQKVDRKNGLVCVCAECNKVIRIIGRLSLDSAPAVTHGICPECADRLYGSIFRKPDTNR